MKRFLLTATLATALLAPSVIVAQEYQRVPEFNREVKAVKAPLGNPLKAYRKAHGIPEKNVNKMITPLQEAVTMPVRITGIQDLNAPAKAEEARGTLFADITYYPEIVYFSDAYWGEVNTQTGKLTKLFNSEALMNGNDYDLQGGVVRDGILYTPSIGEEVCWNAIDINTGDVLPPIHFGPEITACAIAMTYDPTTDTFHYIGFASQMGDALAYYQIDGELVTPGATVQGTYINNVPTGMFIPSLAYCPVDNQIYAFDANNFMYTLEEDGSFTRLASLDHPRVLMDDGYSGQCVYSPLDRAFVVYHRNNDMQRMQLVYIDFDTQEVTVGATVDKVAFASVIYCPDSYAPQNAPAAPEAPVFKFDKSSLSGVITITAPTLYYSGKPIEEKEIDAEVLIDGKEFFTGKLAPGASKDIDITKEEGSYTLDYYCSINGEDSPVTTVVFSVGNDNPCAVTNLKISDTHLSWDAPTAGAHDGYVDLDALTYDVYFDKDKINDAPITTNSYDFENPKDLAYRTVTVYAIANGQQSAPTRIHAIIGEPLAIPYMLQPTAQEAKTFTAYDNNADGATFVYDVNSNGMVYFRLNFGAMSSSFNDWLFLPKTMFDTPDKLYSLTFDYMDAFIYDNGHPLSVFIGDAPNPRAMKEEIYSIDNVSSKNEFIPITMNFAVAEPGVKYIGILFKQEGTNGGMCLANFNLQAKGSSAVPANPEVTITPADKAELEATVSVTMPTDALNGSKLDASKDVTVTVTGGTEPLTLTGKPGATASGIVEVKENGSHRFTIVPSNENGEGMLSYQTVYIGLDTPTAPKNIKLTASDDNLSGTLTWDAPSTVGVHGGYVEVSDLKYNIYTVSSISYTKVGETYDLSYTFSPLDKTLYRYNVGPTAVNEMGESKNSQFVADQIGNPYNVPFFENFNTSSFSYSPWNYDASTPVVWESFGPNNGLVAGGAPCEEGGIYCYLSDGEKSTGRLFVPKFNTLNCNELQASVNYLDHLNAGDVRLYARSSNHREAILIAEYKAEHNVKPRYVEVGGPLPEDMHNQGWVALEIEVDLNNPNQFGILDNVKCYQDVDYDFKVASITGKSVANIGDTQQYLVTVVNNGREVNRGKLKTELVDEKGNVVQRMEYDVPRLNSGREFQKYCDVSFTPEMSENKTLTLRATVIGGKDEIAINDVMEMPIELTAPMLPLVYDLKADWNDSHDKVTLTWSEPDLKYGGYDDMELYEPFKVTDKIGPWKNIDEDGRQMFAINGLRWANDDKPQAWHVFNAEKLGVMNDARLAPHSGKQYLMARQSYDGDATDEAEMYKQAADWLISPEIVGGSKISFWYGTISTSYHEYVYLFYSTTDDNIESFQRIRSFDKYGPEGWELVEWTLPEDAKYFALVYSSIDSMAALLDDITYVPVELDTWVIDHYGIGRHDDEQWNGYVKVGETKDLSFVDENIGDKTAFYNVKTFINYNGRVFQGPWSNTASAYSSTGVDDDFAELTGIYGGKGEIIVEGYAGSDAALYSADGKIVALQHVSDARQSIPADAGVYIVKIGNSYAKVMVK